MWRRTGLHGLRVSDARVPCHSTCKELVSLDTMHLHSFSTFVYFFTCSTLALSAALTRKVDLPVKALRPRPVPSLITSNIKYGTNL